MNGPLHGSPFRANGSSTGRERDKNGVRTREVPLPFAPVVPCRASRSHAFSGKEKAWLREAIVYSVRVASIVGAPQLVSSGTL